MAVYKRGKNWVADFYLGGRGGRGVRRTAPSKSLAMSIERAAKFQEYLGDLL